jgi:hypothetical protein
VNAPVTRAIPMLTSTSSAPLRSDRDASVASPVR